MGKNVGKLSAGFKKQGFLKTCWLAKIKKKLKINKFDNLCHDNILRIIGKIG